jgi:hypothetical protein
LFRKLSRRGKLATSFTIALFVAAVAVGLVLLIPVITTSKREQAAKDRREAAQFRRDRIAQLTREQRPRTGTLPASLAAGAATTALQGRIARDAAARVRSGEFQTPVKRVDCSVLTGTKTLLLSCVAVTSDIPGGDVSRGGRVGYPYRARVQLSDGHYAFCKLSGRPGEGSLGTGVHVPLSPSCGG